MKSNLHTHSTYCDGKDTLEEMIEKAIELKFDILGFSGHGYFNGDACSSMTKSGQEEYKKEVRKLQNKYKDSLEIYLGVEMDQYGPIEDRENFDYLIGSKHSFLYNGKYYPIDATKELFIDTLNKVFNGDIYKLAENYYDNIITLSNNKDVDIIGHIDLISKYNDDQYFFQFNDQRYLQYAYNAVRQCIKNKKIIEVNTGAIARGYRSKPYPDINILKMIYDLNGNVCINSDCHDKNYLDCYFKESYQLLKDIGFKQVTILKDNNFKQIDINLMQ